MTGLRLRGVDSLTSSATLADAASTVIQFEQGDIGNDRRVLRAITAGKISVVTDDTHGAYGQLSISGQKGGMNLKTGPLGRTSPTGGEARRVQLEVSWSGFMPLFDRNVQLNAFIYNYSGGTVKFDATYYLVDVIS